MMHIVDGKVRSTMMFLGISPKNSSIKFAASWRECWQHFSELSRCFDESKNTSRYFELKESDYTKVDQVG